MRHKCITKYINLWHTNLTMNLLKRFIPLLLSLTTFIGTFSTNTIIYASETINTKTGITVKTYDTVTNQPLAGIRIKIENITAGQYKDYGTIVSDANGNVILDNIPVGWYRITEVNTIKGYTLNNAPITRYFDSSELMHNVTISNKAQQSLNILKIDTETGKGLAGAVFEIRNSNNALVATETTGVNGYAVIPYIEPGSYTVTEIQAPDGYDRDTTPQTIQIDSSESNPYILVFGNHEYSSLCIRKIDEATNQPLADTHFKITLANGTSIANDIVTDVNGFAFIKNISAGTYKISETQAPDGYIKDLKTAEVTFGVNKENKLVTITNSRPGGIIVHSADTLTGKPLTGTKLKLYNKDNVLLKENISTDNNGIATFSDLESGTYTVIASSPTEGYILDNSALTVKVRENEISEITFTSTIKPSILIKSIDAKTGLALPNTSFELRKIDGTIIGNYVTGSDGSVTIPNCEVGYYLVEETKAPDGYVLTTASQTIGTKKGELSVITFTNRAKPYISIESVIKGSNTPLAGASFELYTLDNKKITSGISDESGMLVFEDIEPGEYIVKHINSPDGYIVDTPSLNIKVTVSASGYARFTSSRMSSIMIQKTDSMTGLPLSGAVFQISSLDGKNLASYVTDSTGWLTSEVLKAGKYMISEIQAPEGYIIDAASRVVEVINNKPTIENFSNSKKSSIVIKSILSNTGSPIENTQFTIASSTTGKIIDSVSTDKSGIAVTKILEPGEYLVRETYIPNGYTPETSYIANVSVRPDSASSVTFRHSTKSVIQIMSLDNHDNPIEGAKYKIVNEADGYVVGYFTTDDTGYTTTPILNAGRYIVSQIDAPNGYITNNVNQTVTVKDNYPTIVRFTNSKKSVINLKKTDSKTGQPLAGAVFTIADSNGKITGRYTTDESGCLTTEPLKPDTYLIREVQAPDGYMIDTSCRTNVIVKADEPTYVSFTNSKKSVIQITKIDSVTSIPLEGAVFNITRQNGEFIGNYTTDTNGMITTPELTPGFYIIKETKAPDGYVLNNIANTIKTTPKRRGFH